MTLQVMTTYKAKKMIMMNSNPHSHRRFPANFRETFGITNKNGTKYKDIISSFLFLSYVSALELKKGFLRNPLNRNDNPYVMHTDYKTFMTINRNEQDTKCIISFQKRTTGNFAMVRLFEEKE